MNITPLTIYLWQLTDKASSVFGHASIVFCILAGLAILINVTCPDRPAFSQFLGHLLIGTKKAIAIALVFGIAYLFTPTSQTIAMMVVIPKIAESKLMQQDVPEIYNAAVQALKDQLTKK